MVELLFVVDIEGLINHAMTPSRIYIRLIQCYINVQRKPKLFLL